MATIWKEESFYRLWDNDRKAMEELEKTLNAVQVENKHMSHEEQAQKLVESVRKIPFLGRKVWPSQEVMDAYREILNNIETGHFPSVDGKPYWQQVLKFFHVMTTKKRELFNCGKAITENGPLHQPRVADIVKPETMERLCRETALDINAKQIRVIIETPLTNPENMDIDFHIKVYENTVFDTILNTTPDRVKTLLKCGANVMTQPKYVSIKKHHSSDEMTISEVPWEPNSREWFRNYLTEEGLDARSHSLKNLSRAIGNSLILHMLPHMTCRSR